MIDEFKLMRDRSRGERVAGFLASDDAKQVIKALEVEYFKKWVSTQPHEKAYREQIWVQMNSLADLLRHLQSVAGGGKLAKKQLELLEQTARGNAA